MKLLDWLISFFKSLFSRQDTEKQGGHGSPVLAPVYNEDENTGHPEAEPLDKDVIEPEIVSDVIVKKKSYSTLS